MEERHRKKRSSARGNLPISLIFLLLLCHWTTGEDVAGVLNSNETVIEPRSVSSGHCSDPKLLNGKETVSCKGFTEIPTGLSTDIHVLDMSEGNHLQTVTDGQLSRANLPSLKHLKLQNCNIFTIQRGAFRGGQTIWDLDLSSNRIEVLDPEVFAGLDGLQRLILSHNPINRMQADSKFPPLPSLTTLDLSGCKIDSLQVGVIDNLVKLERLYLKKNHLEKLDWRLFEKTKILNALDLSDNKWNCDCHVKFLIDVLYERGLSNAVKSASCSNSSTGRIEVGKKWDNVSSEDLVCGAEIHHFTLESYDVLPISKAVEHENDNYIDHDNEHGKVKLGQDVYFECEYSGYPAPEVTWLKGDRQIITEPRESARNLAMPALSQPEMGDNANNETAIALSTPHPPPEIKPKIEVQDINFELDTSMDEEEKKRSHRFKKNLVLRRVEAKDRGMYVCLVKNPGGQQEKAVYLNMTLPMEESLYLGGRKGLAIWMWILIAVVCILILVLVMLCVCLIWKRKEKTKQEGFRKVIHEKFKDSNIDIGELIDIKSPTSNTTKDSNHQDGSTPLLDGRSEASTVLISDHFPPQKANHLPDVALGNYEAVRNSAIFSPNPPANGHITPADARKEFFARQISEPYLRPGSAMSLSRPPHINAAQKRYIFANNQMQSEPIPGIHGGQESHYAVPDHIRTLPRSGSAMSMSAIPDYDLRRQMFLRQNSQPFYATASRIPNRNRNPSVSSEPPHELGAYNYSTLPRRPRHLNYSRPVSPTNSVSSSYSTLSWRPMVNPVTGVVSDGIGPRTGADGGSTLSLNKTPDSLTGSTSKLITNGDGLESMNRAMMMTPVQINGGGKIKSLPRDRRLGHNRTPSSLTRGHNDFFSFEPIKEVDVSESASNLNLDNAGGRETPQSYTTQSLARGEPRFKKKKPPPIRVIPSNLKEPSRAFEHLKGRSASPALRNAANTTNQSKERASPVMPVTEPVIVEDLSIRKNKSSDRPTGLNPNISNVSHVLESPIDEETSEAVEPNLPIPKTQLPTKTPPPPPPPKPKRSPQALAGGSQDSLDAKDTKENGVNASSATDTGTVV